MVKLLVVSLVGTEDVKLLLARYIVGVGIVEGSVKSDPPIILFVPTIYTFPVEVTAIPP
jgi:hypothetical protein